MLDLKMISETRITTYIHPTTRCWCIVPTPSSQRKEKWWRKYDSHFTTVVNGFWKRWSAAEWVRTREQTTQCICSATLHGGLHTETTKSILRNNENVYSKAGYIVRNAGELERPFGYGRTVWGDLWMWFWCMRGRLNDLYHSKQRNMMSVEKRDSSLL